MFFTLGSIFVLVISFFLLLLGSFVFYKDSKEHTNQSFFFLTISILIWTLSRYFEDNISNVPLSYIFMLLDFASGAFFAFSILLFCLDIVKNRFTKNVFFRTAFFILPACLSILIFWTPLIIDGYTLDEANVINPIYGSLELLYDVIVLLVPLLGVGFIIFGLRKTKPEERGPYLYSLLGIFLSVAIILGTNVLFVDYIATSSHYQIYSLLGTFSPLLIILFPGYAILRYRLFNTKVFAAETFSFIILSITFVQIFVSDNFPQIIVRSLTFFAMFFMLGLFVKSVGREVKRKEELQVLSDKLAVANERLQQLDLEKSEFISIASHQLRTPLTAIKGYISLVLEGSYGEVPASIQDIMNKVYTVNDRLTHLVEDLLNVSRIEAGRIQYNFEPTHLEGLVGELVDMFTLTAKNKGLSLSLKLPAKPLPELLIDPNKIKEVVSNLIDNSLKYTKEGGTTVSVEAVKKTARIIISDTGIGIKPENITRLFEKFTRTKETTKMVASGTGLGLYVGKNFVEAHGGKIWAESDGVDKGSRFIIELPFVNSKIKAGTSDQPTRAVTLS